MEEIARYMMAKKWKENCEHVRCRGREERGIRKIYDGEKVEG